MGAFSGKSAPIFVTFVRTAPRWSVVFVLRRLDEWLRPGRSFGTLFMRLASSSNRSETTELDLPAPTLWRGQLENNRAYYIFAAKRLTLGDSRNGNWQKWHLPNATMAINLAWTRTFSGVRSERIGPLAQCSMKLVHRAHYYGHCDGHADRRKVYENKRSWCKYMQKTSSVTATPLKTNFH